MATWASIEINARASRANYFDATLFSDPAWDILLELFAAEHEGRRVQVTSVGLAAGIPLTTALRWIGMLEHRQLIERRADPLDRRRTYLSLTDEGARLLTEYFERRSETC